MREGRRAGCGRGSKDWKEGIFRFLVMRQSFIKKTPVWNEWVAGRAHPPLLTLTTNPSQLEPNS